MTTDFPTAPSAYGLEGLSAAVTVEKSLHASHTEILTPPRRGVGPPHAARYLAASCYRFNRRFDLRAMHQHLLTAAVCSSPQPLRSIRLADVHCESGIFMIQAMQTQSACQQCGKPFSCGAENGEKTCWCMGLPPLAGPRPAGASCMCPDCLRQALAQEKSGTDGALL